ncbi:hypothetical protein AVEN_105894-1, partial [Araneus ventricosus]
LVPNLGCHPAPDPSMAHYLYTGPMCRYAEDLIVSMKVLSSESGMSISFGQKEEGYILVQRTEAHNLFSHLLKPVVKIGTQK